MQRLIPSHAVSFARYEAWIACLAAALVAVRVQLPLTAPFGLVVAIAVLPVALPHLRRYRGMVLFASVVVAAVIAGYVLTEISTGPTSASLMTAQSLRLLSVPAILLVLLWGRSVIGVRRVIQCFAVGLIASVAWNGLSAANPWKFSLALPVTLLLLSIAMVYRRKWPQVLVAIGLAAVCVAFDSRSAAGFLLVAAALTLMSDRRPAGVKDGTGGRTRWGVLIQIAAVLAGAYFLLQGAILEGMLGDEIQARSEAQIAASGSLLTGGRPEMGAAFALIVGNPLGIGSGATPTPSDILLAKTGMSQLGYDPNNGYVENYMFGGVFEVHSVLGDLWLLFGPLGAVVVVLSLFQLVRGMTLHVTTALASAAVLYVAIRSIWDLGFSPLYTSASLLPLALAVTAHPVLVQTAETVDEGWLLPADPSGPSPSRARG